MDILFQAGLAPDSIAVFMTNHPRLTLSKFQRALRRIHHVDDTDTSLLPPSLVADPLWDWLDSDTIMGLVLWFAQSSDTGGNNFDWIHEFDSDAFALFLSPPALQNSPPAAVLLEPPSNTPHANLGSTLSPPGLPSPPLYSHSYHDAILQADTKDLERRSGTGAATAPLSPHPLWKSTSITTAINIDK